MYFSRRNILKSLGLSTLALTGIQSFAKATELESPSFPDADDPDYWKKIRGQFSLAKDKVFFNVGTVGAMPQVVVDKMVEHVKYLSENVADWAYKDDNKEEFISGYNNLLGIRTKVAGLLNATVPEIAMTDNVTHGMSYIANGITLQPGDEILTTDQEHAGGKGGWLVKEKRYGVVFKTATVAKPAKKPIRGL